MAACGSLRPLFEKPMPENQALIESLPWNQTNNMHHQMDQTPSNEIFSEPHFKEKSNPSSPPVNPSPCPPPPSSSITSTDAGPALDQKKPTIDLEQATSTDSLLGKPQNPIFSEPGSNSGGFASMLSSSPGEPYRAASCGNPCLLPPAIPESLHLCTEGLGFESSDNVEMGGDREETGGDTVSRSGGGYSMRCWSEAWSRKGKGTAFPPPISCIGSSGKPSICFKSYKGEGRFVMREVPIPLQEFLHASREDGTLKLHLVQPEEVIEEEEEEEEEESEEDEKQSSNNNGNSEDNRTVILEF